MFPSKNEVFNKIEILKSNSARVDLEFENVHETRYFIIFFVVLLFRFALIFHFWARISFFPTMIEAQHRMQTFDDKFVRLQGQSIKLI